MRIKRTNRITMIAVMSALALIAFIIEGLFPPLFIPGAKMGISNIFSLASIIILGPVDAVIVVLVRTLIGGLFSNISMIIYSITAGIISISLEILLIYTFYPKISLLAVSVSGSVIHNLTQNIIYMLITGVSGVMVYSPYLVIIGLVSGLIIGAAAQLIIQKMPKLNYKMNNGRLTSEGENT